MLGKIELNEEEMREILQEAFIYKFPNIRVGEVRKVYSTWEVEFTIPTESDDTFKPKRTVKLDRPVFPPPSLGCPVPKDDDLPDAL